jgi:hypothetical protein
MEKYVYSMVAEVVAVVAIAVMAEQVPRPPLPGMLRGLEHLVRVTEPTAVLQLVMHQTLVVLLVAAVVREFLLRVLLRPTGVQ